MVFAQRPLTGSSTVAVTTVCVGAVVALAPVVSMGARIPMLVAALVAWAITAGHFVFGVLAPDIGRPSEQGAGRSGNHFERAAAWLGLACTLVAVVAATSLDLVRVVADRPDLVWNIDWRYTLSHAQAVAHTGGTERALDYAGVPIDYHVGPAWLAGAWGYAFGGGVPDVLFGAVPLLSMLALAAGLALLLANHGLSLRTSLAATGMALVLPAADLVAYRLVRSPRLLFDEDTWDVGISLMLNSYFGLAVGASALALLTMRRTGVGHLLLGAVGLASLIGLKPQYFVAFGLLAGIIGLQRMLPGPWRASSHCGQSHSGPASTSARWLWGAGLLMVALPVVLRIVKLPASVEAVLVPVVFAVLLLLTWRPSDAASQERSPGIVIAAAAALVIAIGLLEWLPAVPSYFGRPAWAPGATGWYQAEHLSIATLLFVVASAVLASDKEGPEAAPSWPAHVLAWQSLLAIALIATTLHLIVFPVRPDVVEQGLRLGGFQIDAFRHQYDIAQAWLPLRLLLSAACIGAACQSVVARSVPWRAAVLAAIALLLCLRAISIVPPLLDPSQGYEAAEDSDLRRTLEAIPVEGSLLVSSDIADPAQDYGRPANGSLLSGYRGHSYFLSELRYLHWTRPDAPERLDALRAFFGSNWTSWHDAWLASHGITHILVSDRCRPVWFNEGQRPLQEIAHHGAWTALRVEPGAGETVIHAVGQPPAWTDMTPAYGLSECLLLRRVVPSRGT